jgi:ribosomal protein RSM22 (predicted rRNA methylase)
MNVSLPPALIAAIDALLQGISRRDLAARAAGQSLAYRGGGGSAGIAGEADVLAYLLARMPATYAAVRAALARLAETVPDFAPQSVADIGAGPGTASWAAVDAWPGLSRITVLDANPAFRAIAATLAKAGLPEVEIMPGDIGATLPKADLVIASYVLAEMPEGRAGEIAARLWTAATRALVIVEPGTPHGFARMRAARAALIAAGAHVAAPCTHDNTCPMAGDDWCHFSQRLPRSRDHMRAKGASVPFEDERYAYVAATRVQAASGARIIRPPVDTKPGTTVPLCDASGLRDAFLARRDKERFRRGRKLQWGDLFLD